MIKQEEKPSWRTLADAYRDIAYEYEKQLEELTKAAKHVCDQRGMYAKWTMSENSALAAIDKLAVVLKEQKE